ncbi:hypothetical protein [Gordonia desulfuricans]|uniref:hypothetical protein n=1 Tax=Gordonia desulfuricans TaxID=89051 RepID=UPI001EE3F40F|nr:hypothetical protein [Gordonia desulfuricans]
MITRASGVDLTQPPPKVNTPTPIDFRLEPLLYDDQRAWALAHTLDVVWRPVLTSVGIEARADSFFQASAVDPDVFVAIVTGARKSRRSWRRPALIDAVATRYETWRTLLDAATGIDDRPQFSVGDRTYTRIYSREDRSLIAHGATPRVRVHDHQADKDGPGARIGDRVSHAA